MLKEEFGQPYNTVEQMTFGHNSVTYRADCDGRELIVRTNTNPQVFERTNTNPQVFERTEANITILKSVGVPVPEVLFTDLSLSTYPFAYMVLTAIDGNDLRFCLEEMAPEEMELLARQIVELQRAVVSLPQGNGFGFVGIGQVGTHKTWTEVVIEQLARSADGLRQEFVNPLISVIRRHIDNSREALDAIGPVCFLDDATTKNVIVKNGELQGIIDNDEVCYGDPVYWLALTQVAVFSDVGEVGQPYVDALIREWSPSENDIARFNMYCAVHAAHFLACVDESAEWAERLWPRHTNRLN